MKKRYVLFIPVIIIYFTVLMVQYMDKCLASKGLPSFLTIYAFIKAFH